MASQHKPPILGSFEDIGEQIKQEITKLPGDMIGSALESVGMNVSSGKKSQTSQTPLPGATGADGSAYQQMDQTTDQKFKKEIARKALEEIMKKSPKQESIWEKIMKEEEQKKETAKQKPQQVMLPSSGARKVPGIKSAIKAKQQGSEIGKNVKHD